MARACPRVSWSRWDTVVMLRLPDVGLTSVPLMSTTWFAVVLGQRVERGPGAQRDERHRDRGQQNPNTTIGTRATATVALRLFTPATLAGRPLRA